MYYKCLEDKLNEACFDYNERRDNKYFVNNFDNVYELKKADSGNRKDVDISFYVQNVHKIDTLQQRFQATFIMYAAWDVKLEDLPPQRYQQLEDGGKKDQNVDDTSEELKEDKGNDGGKKDQHVDDTTKKSKEDKGNESSRVWTTKMFKGMYDPQLRYRICVGFEHDNKWYVD